MSHELDGYKTTVVEHFYQPRRKAAHERLSDLGTDPGGKDWNSLIANECYVPQLQRGTLDVASFDCFTLLREELSIMAPQEMDKLKIAMRERGVGDPFLHVLLPDLNDQDQRILINAGMLQFEREAGVRPKWLWAPETALNSNVLKNAILAGYEGILCSPEQINANGEADNRPVRVHISGVGEIILLPFDRPVSSNIAFADKGNADTYAAEVIVPRLLRLPKSDTLLICTDGETFGHHFPGADVFLDYLLKFTLPGLGVAVLGINQVRDSWEASDFLQGELKDRTAWSCPHGNLVRWHGACGCEGGSNGAWKEPFSAALQHVNESVTAILNRLLPADWEQKLTNNFAEAFAHTGSQNDINSLFAAKASALAAMTSCGTFFGSPLTSGKINVLFVRQTMEHLKDAGQTQAAEQIFNRFKSEISHGYDQYTGQTLDRVFADLLVPEL